MKIFSFASAIGSDDDSRMERLASTVRQQVCTKEWDGFYDDVLELYKKLGVRSKLSVLGVETNRINGVAEMAIADPSTPGHPSN